MMRLRGSGDTDHESRQEGWVNVPGPELRDEVGKEDEERCREIWRVRSMGDKF